jgi:glycyl-tRNA synthetase beta chain
MSVVSSLLLEIGTEEIPARFLPLAFTMLKDRAESLLGEYSIDFTEVKSYVTPRRLALIVHGIPSMQKDRIREIYGPPKKASFDDTGKLTKAAIGFANSQGVDVESLVIKKRDKGDYLVAIIDQKGAAVREILPEILQKIVLSLHFPKSMRWGTGDLRFVRPIHWILAVFDNEVIPFEVDGIKSGNVTHGHRFLSPATIVVKDIPSYPDLLRSNYVIVDQDRRKRIVREGIMRLSLSAGGDPLDNDELLEHVTNLTEYPVPFLCSFPKEYLKLPRELLITVMRDHQKFFGVKGAGDKLRNSFIVVSNTKEENSETVKAGAERVIKARFEDARFYFEEDLKRPLHSRIGDLKRVTFHERLGSLYDKTEKVVKLASHIAESLFPDRRGGIERAAWLSKTDLVSGVVGEFPELQGLMGKYYALHDGEETMVAEAIMEQYLPAHSGDRLPETDEGSVISLADKMDNVLSFFSIGLTPTGSEDPFALRRQALAVIAILMEKKYPLTLGELVKNAEETAVMKSASLSDEVLQFFRQRIETLLASQGYDSGIIQSVLHLTGDVPLAELKERIFALQKFAERPDYNRFLLSVKRVYNIIPHVPIPALHRDLLTEREEKTLFSEMINITPAMGEMLGRRKFYDVLKLLSTLTGLVNDFFDKVLVMDKREEVRLNRLALLRDIREMTLQIADFSKLAERILV